jgi:iron complex transport system substrate-binding protein
VSAATHWRRESKRTRIVSLLPSATEILFAIGAGREVVGVTHECDFPSEALALPKLTAASGPPLATPSEIDRHVRASVHAGSSLYRLDADLLEHLQPDLIVTQELCAVCAVSYEIVATAAKCLRSCHPERIVSLEPTRLREVFATIEFLGELTGHSREAQALVARLQARIDALKPSSGRPSTLVLEWTDPPMSAGHWIPELIEIAGGRPVLAHPGSNSRRLEWEAIAHADPDTVIVAPCGFDLERTKESITALEAVAVWRSLRARRNGRVLALDGNAYLSRPGPRLVDATEIIAWWYTSRAEYAG